MALKALPTLCINKDHQVLTKKFIKENETLAEQYMEDREDKLSGSISLAKGKSLAELDTELSEALAKVKSEIPKFNQN